MKVIHVLRKPCSESTVAANVLRYGTGALNIDATRIKCAPGDEVSLHGRNATENGWDARWSNAQSAGQTAGQALGRWPANLILQHLEGCEHIGTKEVRVVGCTDKTQHIYEGGFLGGVRTSMANYASKGRETVAAWVCAPGCPVAALDAQSGLSRSAVREGGAGENLDPTKEGWRFKRVEGGYTDTGGASRFFKQVGGAPKPPTDG